MLKEGTAGTGAVPRDKAGCRQHFLAHRARLTADEVTRHSGRIHERLLDHPPTRAAKTVFCFISTGREVETRTLIDRLLASGTTVLVPRIARLQPMAAVPFPGWDGLVAGSLGIPAPPSGEDVRGHVDVCITPGLAFTGTGTRLGYGKGYYDRWFAAHPQVARLAVAFECQVTEHLPREPHDLPVHAIFTERRLIVTGS